MIVCTHMKHVRMAMCLLSLHPGGLCQIVLCCAVLCCAVLGWAGHQLRLWLCTQGLAADGQLGKLMVNDLQKYCKVNQLPKSGKKDEIVQRILAHLSHH